MTPEELKERVREICAEASKARWNAIQPFREKLHALFEQHREEVFKISQRLPERWEIEKTLAEKDEHNFDWSAHLRNESLAFITCSCGSREDSCSEDGVGNFSKFIFTSDGSVFRSVEKKQ